MCDCHDPRVFGHRSDRNCPAATRPAPHSPNAASTSDRTFWDAPLRLEGEPPRRMPIPPI